MPDVDKFLVTVQKHGGSDLHLVTGASPALRLHGVLTQMKMEALPAEQVQNLLDQIMTRAARKQFMETGDADFSYELPGVGRFRCSVFMDRKGPAAIFRLIPVEALSAEQLGIGTSTLQLCTLPRGLVLIAGPGGSGKTSTLTALLNYLNDTTKAHIVTVEQQIEFLLENRRCRINQRESMEHTASLAAALRASLRHDPDIIAISELSDEETVRLALEVAEAGHLVLATIRSPTSTTAINRIISLFPADRQAQMRTQLAINLKGIVAQCLVRRKGGKGRLAAREMLTMNSEIAAAIREGRLHDIEPLMQTGAKEGMAVLNDVLVKLVLDDQIEPLDAVNAAEDRRDVLQKLRVAGIEVTITAPVAAGTSAASVIAAPVASAPAPAESAVIPKLVQESSK